MTSAINKHEMFKSSNTIELYFNRNFLHLALLYSLLGVAVSKTRGNVDDELNTIAAGTAAAALFRSTKGIKTSIKAGIFGLVASSLYVAAFGRWSR
ncbi:hypothetical protein ACOME3_007012 [Neoechinorhynchus agilis]